MSEELPRLKNIKEMNFIVPPDDIPKEIIQQNKTNAEQMAREDELAVLNGIRGILGHSAYIAKTSVGKNQVEDQIDINNIKQSIQSEMQRPKQVNQNPAVAQQQVMKQERPQQRPITAGNQQPQAVNMEKPSMAEPNIVYQSVSNDNIIKLIKKLGSIEQKLDIIMADSEKKMRKAKKIKPKTVVDK